MANKYTFKVIVAELIRFAKLNIKDLAQSELSNKDKKNALDRAIRGYLVPLLETSKISVPWIPAWIVKWFFNKFILDNIPVITQAIFDLIQSRIEGVTK